MEGIRTPTEFRFTGNVDQAWSTFLQRFQLYEEATSPPKARSDGQKLALFLTVAGQAAIDVFNTFTFDPATPKNYANMVAKFDAYCRPKKNETHERYVFRLRLQKEGETFDQYLLDLQLKVRTCNFGNLEDSLIRDQIVAGIRDNKVRRSLLAEDNLTLGRAVKLCQASETMSQQLQTYTDHGGIHKAHVDTVNQNRFRGQTNRSHNEQALKQRNTTSQGNSHTQSGNKTNKLGLIKNCYRCLQTHQRLQCPAYNQFCLKCKGKGHFAKACKSKQSVNEVRANNGDSDDDFLIEALEADERTGNAGRPKDWIVQVMVGDKSIAFKIDTGAQTNLLPLDLYRQLKPQPEIKETTVALTAYGGSKVTTHGVISVQLKVKNIQQQATLVLVGERENPILGLETCEQLGLVKRVYHLQEAITGHDVSGLSVNTEETPTNVGADPLDMKGDAVFKEDILRKYPHVFKGIGCLATACSIQLKETAVPIITSPRRVPYALKDRLKVELDRLGKQNIIRKVNEPTEWVSPLVIIEKKDKRLRLCLDPKTLNENIKREHYQIPTKEEVQADLAGAKYFSKLDAASGFYQIPLDKKSEVLTTFNTPFGRYCFRRLPFGISSAPEIFFKIFNQIFDGAKGARPLHDDVLVWGATLEQHDERLHDALERLSSAKATLNPSKCVFRTKMVTYMGELISSKGTQPDPAKVEAIKKMPTPKCKADVQRALGLVNFLSKFVPNLSTNTTHLRNFLKKDSDPQWLVEHDKEWQRIKDVLTQYPVLMFYDQNRDIKVSTDASNCGLGACLLQLHGKHWKPVAYASRTLTDAETRYAQIEKENLGLVFGCKKFHNYIYGRVITLETDHKPLIAMAKRVLADVPLRLQRLFLKLSKYQYMLEYKPGKELILADALSRASLPLQPDEVNVHDDVQIHVNAVIRALPIGCEMLTKLREETKKDPTLMLVKHHLINGWDKREAKIQAYATVQTELAEADGLVLKGTNVVVPVSLRETILNIIHDGHLGIEKCKRRARQAVYWPNMNADIEAKNKRCATCNRFQYAQQYEQYETLMLRETPKGAWHRIGTDWFHYSLKDYIVVINHK